MKPTIGSITVYNGNDHPYLRGFKVRILSIMREIPVAEDHLMYKTDEEVAAGGGVRSTDWADVAPIMEEGRTSFVSSDARVIDLECFAYLREP